MSLGTTRSVNTITIPVPDDFDLKVVPEGLTPAEGGNIITFGAEMLRAGKTAVLRSRGDEIAAIQHAFAEKEGRLTARLEAERETWRLLKEAGDAEMKRTVARVASLAEEANVAMVSGLRAELAAARTDLAKTQQAQLLERSSQADFFIETARKAQEDAARRCGIAEENAAKRIAAIEADYAKRFAELEKSSASLKNAERAVSALGEQFGRVFSSAGANSATKGRAGEHGLEAIVTALFPEAEFADCSKNAGKGDATLTLRRGDRAVRIMVESKNMERVQTRDLAKFARDCAGRRDVDAALFASLTSETIPRFGSVAFRVESDLPVLYVADVVTNPERLRVGIESLLFAVLNKPVPAEEDDDGADTVEGAWREVGEAIAQAFGAVTQHASRVKAMRQSIGTMSETLCAMENESTIYLAAVNALWTRHPTLKLEAATESTSSGFIAAATPSDPETATYLKIRRFIDEHGRDPSASEATAECGVSSHYIRKFGGLREIVKKSTALVL